MDSGATQSFISETFVNRLNIIHEDMELRFKVSIPSVDQIVTSSIVKNLELRLQKDVVRVDLIVLPMPEFDIILGVNLLSLNGALIDFWQSSVSIRQPNEKYFVFEVARNKKMPHIIPCMCERKLMRRGCQDFLACVTSTHVLESRRLEDVEVVRDFPSVFPEDGPSIPPDREVEFSIELMSGTDQPQCLFVQEEAVNEVAEDVDQDVGPGQLVVVDVSRKGKGKATTIAK
ncbi:uncharacterized protein LOC142519720 [Primulina tabacum]|uniref:uncharacterized protein LOC142519720 n=1 Tax=Primulina tabacum TaxID=48773 RepID=UPI003F599D93